MNSGSHLISSNFLTSDETKVLRETLEGKFWKPVHGYGKYRSDGWSQVSLISGDEPTEDFFKFPELKKVRDWCKAPIEMMVFYNVVPGHMIHPHRDLSGTFELGRLRFHIPIKTNEQCKFFVSKKPLFMSEGSVWALNTSYLHSVENHSQENRIHLVLQVEVNDWVRSLVPRTDWRYQLHKYYFWLLIFKKAAVTLLRNPKEFRRRMFQGYFFLRRALGIR